MGNFPNTSNIWTTVSVPSYPNRIDASLFKVMLLSEISHRFSSLCSSRNTSKNVRKLVSFGSFRASSHRTKWGFGSSTISLSGPTVSSSAFCFTILNLEWHSWKNVSNTLIFKNKPKLVISPYGTILHEAAYHGIISIAAGINPYMSYNFVFTPSTKKEYFNLLIKGINKELKLDKDFKKRVEEC